MSTGVKRIKTSVPDLAWPAVLTPQVAQFYALWRQLEDSQWLDPASLDRLQKEQLWARLRAISQHRPDWASGWRHLPWHDTQLNVRDLLRHLPILTRRELQTQTDQVFYPTPESHGTIKELKTSGSSGELVTVRTSAQLFQLRAALTLRGHFWHGIDFRANFAAIRGGIKEKSGRRGTDAARWGGMISELWTTGKSHVLDITTSVQEQAEWLQKRQPHILLTVPSNLEGLLDALPRPWQGLQHVLSISETLHPELRQRLKEQWFCQVHDKYSSEELGSIATECEHGNYHCSEHLIVEVLRDDGQPAAPGEVGRILITDTWNAATHMIRYDIRDYAVVGESGCACGRGLPTLQRIMGRVRHLMILPNGRKFWPLFGMRRYGEIAPIHQMQFVQTALDHLLVRYVCDRSLTPAEEESVKIRVCDYLEYPLQMNFERVHEPLNTGRSHKFEEFKSLISQ